MQRRPLAPWLLAVALVAASACTGVPEATPTATPEGQAVRPAATPTPSPTPTPLAAEPAPPFELAADPVHVLDTDNAPILSTEPRGVDETAAEQAAQDATAVLEAFLNAQYTDPATWFSEAPLAALLTDGAQQALGDEERRGLGVLDLDVQRVEPGPASVDPMVTMHGSTPRHVTLTFHAALVGVLTSGAEIAITQAGHAVFVPDGHGWRAQAVDVTLEREEEP